METTQGVRQSGSTALLSGTNPLAKFYTESPSSLLVQPASSTTGVPNPRSYIDFPYPSCGPGGNLVLVTGSTTNKCAASQPFAFSGSGGSLSFGAQGGFYVCGMDQHVSSLRNLVGQKNVNSGAATQVYYQKSTATTPSGCTPTFLFPLNP